MQIYNGEDYDKIIECLTTLKNKKLNIKKELVEIKTWMKISNKQLFLYQQKEFKKFVMIVFV